MRLSTSRSSLCPRARRTNIQPEGDEPRIRTGARAATVSSGASSDHAMGRPAASRAGSKVGRGTSLRTRRNGLDHGDVGPHPACPARKPWRERITLLQTIPGIDRPSACAILAEIGPHLDAFANAERLAARAGLYPGNDRSAGKRLSARARMGNKALRAVLVECAHGAARTHGCQFRGYHKALMSRLQARHRRHRAQAPARALRRAARRPTLYRDPVYSLCCRQHGMVAVFFSGSSRSGTGEDSG